MHLAIPMGKSAEPANPWRKHIYNNYKSMKSLENPFLGEKCRQFYLVMQFYFLWGNTATMLWMINHVRVVLPGHLVPGWRAMAIGTS